MARLFYGHDGLQFDFDDRTLAHLQFVIFAKLRQGEGFCLTWSESISVGSGRSTIWLDPSIPLRFRYSGPRPVLNRSWISALTAASYAPDGLLVTPEPPADEKADPA